MSYRSDCSRLEALRDSLKYCLTSLGRSLPAVEMPAVQWQHDRQHRARDRRCDESFHDEQGDLVLAPTDVAEVGVGHLARAVDDAAHDGDLDALQVRRLRCLMRAVVSSRSNSVRPHDGQEMNSVRVMRTRAACRMPNAEAARIERGRARSTSIEARHRCRRTADRRGPRRTRAGGASACGPRVGREGRSVDRSVPRLANRAARQPHVASNGDGRPRDRASSIRWLRPRPSAGQTRDLQGKVHRVLRRCRPDQLRKPRSSPIGACGQAQEAFAMAARCRGPSGVDEPNEGGGGGRRREPARVVIIAELSRARTVRARADSATASARRAPCDCRRAARASSIFHRTRG